MLIKGVNSNRTDVTKEGNNRGPTNRGEEKKKTEFPMIGLNECQRSGQRMVVLDTETTGLDFRDGHKIIEIGCVELFNNKITGRFYQTYINPCREVSPGAFKVTGLGRDFLKDKPLFRDIAQSFLDFIADSPLIIHNAQFDVLFLNHELSLIKREKIQQSVLDTLVVSRELFAGKPCNLDAVCRRLNIDNSMRSFHGALLDAQILSKVYLGLLSLKKGQRTLDVLMEDQMEIEDSKKNIKIKRNLLTTSIISTEEMDGHKNFWSNH
jgi:DNA polymerase-3 subunit epsilon